MDKKQKSASFQCQTSEGHASQNGANLFLKRSNQFLELAALTLGEIEPNKISLPR